MNQISDKSILKLCESKYLTTASYQTCDGYLCKYINIIPWRFA